MARNNNQKSNQEEIKNEVVEENTKAIEEVAETENEEKDDKQIKNVKVSKVKDEEYSSEAFQKAASAAKNNQEKESSKYEKDEHKTDNTSDDKSELTKEEKERILEVKENLNLASDKIQNLLIDNGNFGSDDCENDVNNCLKLIDKKEIKNPLDIEDETSLLSLFKSIVIKLMNNVFVENKITDNDMKFMSSMINKKIKINLINNENDEENHIFIQSFKNINSIQQFCEKISDTMFIEIKNDNDLIKSVKVSREYRDEFINKINSKLFPIDSRILVEKLKEQYPAYTITIDYLLEEMDRILGTEKLFVEADFEPRLNRRMSECIVEQAQMTIDESGILNHLDIIKIVNEQRRKCTNKDNEKVQEFFKRFFLDLKPKKKTDDNDEENDDEEINKDEE